MSQVLVISGHPNLEISYTNSVILKQLQQQINNVEVRRLDQLYPNFDIDVEAEQQALMAADIIVLQFPFYWYSLPALLKKWVDDVFSFNFAYGPQGDKLKGKEFILSFTVGGPKESYDPLGYNHFTIEQMLYPLQQTAYLAGMNYKPPIYSHRMVYIPNVYNELSDVQNRAMQHADRLAKWINGRLASEEVKIQQFVADWFGQMDRLSKDVSWFTQFLSEKVNMKMPEGEFIGHAGFSEWYQGVSKIFKPNCSHQVEQVDIVHQNDIFIVDLRVRLRAETFPSSEFKGADINLLVDEKWQVRCLESGLIIIDSYEVKPIGN